MEPNHNSLSPKTHIELPFDVLGVIFEYYVDTETIFHPLETLLLVSRLWNQAALNHKALWGKLHIHLGHKPTHDAWKIILPRRLERAGSAPLSIEIRYAREGIPHPYYDLNWRCAWMEQDSDEIDICACVVHAARCAQDLLEMLTGPGGEYCKRWTKLHIKLGGVYRKEHANEFDLDRASLLCDPLVHPMPLVESIHLRGIEVRNSESQTLFPSTPLVRVVHFHQCSFDSLDRADFSSAESITIQGIGITKRKPHPFQFNSPTSIKVIHIDNMYFPLPKINRSLPQLHTLHLGYCTTDIIAPDFDFPSLETLSIQVSLVHDHNHLERFTSSINHPLSTVKVLTLAQDWSCSRRLLVNLKPFLEELESIESISASREVLAFTLKHILAENMQREVSRIWSNLSGRSLELVHTRTGLVACLVFDEAMQDIDICTACKALHLPDPMRPWDEYAKEFGRDGSFAS